MKEDLLRYYKTTANSVINQFFIKCTESLKIETGEDFHFTEENCMFRDQMVKKITGTNRII